MMMPSRQSWDIKTLIFEGTRRDKDPYRATGSSKTIQPVGVPAVTGKMFTENIQIHRVLLTSGCSERSLVLWPASILSIHSAEPSGPSAAVKSPGCCGSVGQALSRKMKGHQLNSWWGHIPTWVVGSAWTGCVREASD